ncbi:MAG: hypothetical protein Q9216_006403, partial [Gyalolechia sp. 2 TL-2023]
MLHHKGIDKSRHYLDLLDTARCSGKWSEIPELARKVGKHSPQRKCLQLTAQAEYQLATASTGLSQIVPRLQSAYQEATSYPEDAFQARICLAWLHWTLNEPELALQTLPNDISSVCYELDRGEGDVSGWSSICAIRGAYIQGDLQEKIGNVDEAWLTFGSILPHIQSTLSTTSTVPEYSTWTEQLLARYCILSNQIMRAAIDKGRGHLSMNATLAPFRAWADLWTSTSKAKNHSGYSQLPKTRHVPRRRVWHVYYDTLSIILRKGITYPAVVQGSSTFVNETSMDNVRALDNPRLLQSIELQRVAGVYEDILLREVSFPKANEANVEVERWADQVMDNWRIIISPSWLHEDIGKGGKESVTRGTLAILYRAATRTFHSTRILRHLFTVHTALAEFDLAAKAFDTYMELVSKGKARVDKSGGIEIGLDDDATVLKTTAAGIEMLCFYGRRKQVERAQEIAVILERWLEKLLSSSDPITSADDNPVDLKEQQKHSTPSVPGEAFAIAHRSLGICRAHWSRLTYVTSCRSELQDKAIASFRTALTYAPPGIEHANVQYALALILAETRNVDEAIVCAKQAISSCTQEDEEPTQIVGSIGSQNSRNRRVLFKVWHLLAFLLSARQDFVTATTSCEAAYELYSDLLESLEHHKSEEGIALPERKGIMELKMSQLALAGILDGPEEAVNACSDLLSLYKQLFVNGEPTDAPAPSFTVSPPDGAVLPSKASNGTIKSARRSLFGRSKEVGGGLPHIAHNPNHIPITGEVSHGVSRDTNISGIQDGPTTERKYQPPHHLARQESRKLQKRQSRKSMASDRRNRDSSPNKSSLANGSEDSAQAISLRVANLKRSSLDTSHGGSNTGEVGPANTTHSDQGTTATQHGEPSRLQPPISQTTNHKDRNPSPKLSKPPFSKSTKTPPILMDSPPDPIYLSADLDRHALTLLVRIWLLIGQLYCDAGMLVDAQGAVSEARRQAQSIEAAVAATESSAQAISSPGWGNVKSVAEIWADVLAVEADLDLQLGNRNTANEAYEKALGWFPDHNAATVGLSNILLDYYDQEEPTNKLTILPKSPSKSKPILASLPTSKFPESQTDQGRNSKVDESPALLSRLAARDRAYGLLSMLTKSGRGWDDSEAWSALARVHEQSGQIDKAKEALWMSERKRKQTSHEGKERPRKKTAVSRRAPEVVKVSVLPEEDEWAPIAMEFADRWRLASTPGLSFPSDLPLKTYTRRRKNETSCTGKSHVTTSEHLLHTSAHPKIDYVAREEGGGSDSLLSHYLGVYDPESGQLQLVRARKLVLRSQVRPVAAAEEKTVKSETVSYLRLWPTLGTGRTLTTRQGLSARSALGLTFGTKKSQRAIEALTKNAISPSKPGRVPPNQMQSALDPIASAVVSSMAATTSMPTREQLQAAVDESKPRPQPNPDAETPADVYPVEQLAGRDVLRQMTIKHWQDAVEAGEEILTKSRFVSHRIQNVVSGGDVRKLKTLKYLLLLLEWHAALPSSSPGKLGGRKVPASEKLCGTLGGWSSSLVDGVTVRFAEANRTVTRWHLDHLITHICALAVTVDGFATDVYDLQQDLKLEMKDLRKYYREIGCR